MAEMAPQERLLPFLLDRLVDEGDGRERAFTVKHYHRAILRDLVWLLNSPTKAERDNLEEFPEVAKSVLNYGMPDMAGSTQSSTTPDMMEKMVKTAIHLFEPRIVRNTLVLEIRGQVWAQPLPESLYMKTAVDLETGACQLQDQLHT